MREKVAIQLILFYTDFITREKDAHMLESYITVKQDGFSEIEIKKSRFICSVKRVTSEEEAKAHTFSHHPKKFYLHVFY